MHWREQGDLGELSAVGWLLEQGHDVYMPFGHSPDCDLVADMEGRLARVQVKTCWSFVRDRWHVRLCTSGGNQSWNRIVKRFSADRCEWLFVHVGDGRRWFIPAKDVEGGNAIILGGPKYQRFEVDPGRPLPAVER